MKNTCLLALTALLLMVLALPVQAQEEARYNFASAQGDKDLKIPPGQEGVGNIYFYNIDGNRITHITLEVSHAPSGWQVSIQPPLGETQVSVSGMPVTVKENLYVEPSELLTVEPQSVPEGTVSIKVPGRGYAIGKRAQLVVKVPASAPLGSTGKITVAAEAVWLGQSGAAAVKQARDFDFSVMVVSASKEFTETVIGQGKGPEPPKETVKSETSKAAPETPPPAPKGESTVSPKSEASKAVTETPPPAPKGESTVFPVTSWLVAAFGAVIIILGVIIVMLIRKRK